MKALLTRSQIMTTVVVMVIALVAPGGSAAQNPCLEFVGAHPYGPIRAATATGDRMVYGSGRVLIVADLTDPSAPVTMGELVLEGRIQTIAASGDLVAAIIKTLGVAVVDISNPASPSLIELIPLYSTSDFAMTTIADGFIYATTDAALATIISVQDPSAPEIVATVGPGEGPASGIGVDHDILYIMTGGTITTYWVIDPANPVEVQSFAESGFSMAVKWPRLYLTDGGSVRVFSCSSPDILWELNPIVLNGGLGWIDIVDSTAVVAGSLNEVSTLFVLDLDLPDPASTAVVFQPFEPALFLNFAESFVFHAKDGEGLTITDLSDPAVPVSVGHVDGSGAAYQVAVAGGRALVQSGFGHIDRNGRDPYDPSFGMRLMDVADPTSPVELDRIDAEFGFAPDLLIERGYAYLPDDFTVFDLSDPYQLSIAGENPVGTYGISKRGSLVYGSSWDEVIHVIDVSDPTDPVEVVPWPPWLFFWASDVAVTPGYGYAVGWDDSSQIGVFAVLDLTGPLSYTIVTSIEVAMNWPAELELHGNRAFVQGEFSFVEIDISNPLEPAILSQIVGHYDGDLEISGDTLYDASGRSVWIYDISLPGSPQLMCELETTEQIRGIALSGGEVYLAHDCIGLSIYRQYGGALFLDGFEIGTAENWTPME